MGVSVAACVRADKSAAMGDVAQRVVRLAARIGATHVAVGSDWDGVRLPSARRSTLGYLCMGRPCMNMCDEADTAASQGVVIPAGLDARGLPLLTSALGSFGLPAQDLDDVMGGSVLRLLRATLPSELSMAEHDDPGVTCCAFHSGSLSRAHASGGGAR